VFTSHKHSHQFDRFKYLNFEKVQRCGNSRVAATAALRCEGAPAIGSLRKSFILKT
jgi:hypothetical protein